MAVVAVGWCIAETICGGKMCIHCRWAGLGSGECSCGCEFGGRGYITMVEYKLSNFGGRCTSSGEADAKRTTGIGGL